jgi:hypothetical protein
MDARSEIREFLTSRRARIAPEQAGLAAFGPRRVPGLRPEEVAVLAGVSVPYCTRIERGDMNGVSDPAPRRHSLPRWLRRATVCGTAGGGRSSRLELLRRPSRRLQQPSWLLARWQQESPGGSRLAPSLLASSPAAPADGRATPTSTNCRAAASATADGPPRPGHAASRPSRAPSGCESSCRPSRHLFTGSGRPRTVLGVPPNWDRSRRGARHRRRAVRLETSQPRLDGGSRNRR